MAIMKRYDASDYETAWWKYLNGNPQMKRFFIVWDSLSVERRCDLIAIARALAKDDKERRRRASDDKASAEV